MDKISVIVPVYNVEKYLERCIDSIIAQTYTNLEIILIDDGSLDKSGEICDRYAKKDGRIKAIHKENGGLSDARNVGIELSTGEYITFVDSDDYISVNMIEKLYDALVKKDANMSLCSFLYVDENGKSIPEMNGFSPIKNEVITGGDILFTKMIETQVVYWVVSWTKLYKKDLFSNARFILGKTNEDEFAANEILQICGKVACIKDAMYYYVQRKNSIMRSKSSVKKMDGAEAYIERVGIFVENKRSDIETYTILFNTVKLLYSRYESCKTLNGGKKRYKELTGRLRQIIKSAHFNDISLNRKIYVMMFWLSPYLSGKIIKNFLRKKL